MDKFKLVDKLKEKAGVSYEEARAALEKCNWDILDAFVFLEKNGRIKVEEADKFYNDEYKENNNEQINYDNDNKNEGSSSKGRNNFEGIFEAACSWIDTCNNIFIEVKKDRRVLLKLPLTLIIVLILFAFWIIIPLTIVGLFCDFEFEVLSKRTDTEKANDILRKFSEIASSIKKKIKINKS